MQTSFGRTIETIEAVTFSGGYTAGASRAMAPVVGLKSPSDGTVAARGPTQLAIYVSSVPGHMGIGLKANLSQQVRIRMLILIVM